MRKEDQQKTEENRREEERKRAESTQAEGGDERDRVEWQLGHRPFQAGSFVLCPAPSQAALQLHQCIGSDQLLLSSSPRISTLLLTSLLSFLLLSPLSFLLLLFPYFTFPANVAWVAGRSGEEWRDFVHLWYRSAMTVHASRHSPGARKAKAVA